MRNIPVKCAPADSVIHCSQEGVNLVLQMLDLLCKLKNDITGLKVQAFPFVIPQIIYFFKLNFGLFIRKALRVCKLFLRHDSWRKIFLRSL